MLKKLKILFAGTSDFSAQHLQSLIKNTNHEIIGVLTKPDYVSKRKNKLNFNSVKKIAKLYNIPIFQPSSFFIKENQELVFKLNPDMIIVVSYGIILPEIILDVPKLGCINVHGSLLPRWRGCAPIQRALCEGDNVTGITIIYMDKGIDTGPIIYRSSCIIKSDDTTFSLQNRLAKIGSNAILTIIKKIVLGDITIEIQDDKKATYAKKINKVEARLNWKLPAIQLERYVRAFNPWPVSYFILNNKIIKVWKAYVDQQYSFFDTPGTILSVCKNGIRIATISGVLVLMQLQLENRRSMLVKEFLNSKRTLFIPGNILD